MFTSWHYTPYMLPLLLGSLICIILINIAWHRRTTPGAWVFGLLMLAVTTWSLAYVMELGSTTLEAKIFWGKVQYLGIVTTPLAWLAFILKFTHQTQWLTRPNIALACLIPAITVGLVWTNEMHHWIWRETILEINGPFPALVLSYGGWFWVNWGLANLYLLAGSVFLLDMLRRTRYVFRLQTITLLFIVLAPWVGNGAYVLRLLPIPNLDLTPFAFALSGLAMSWNLFRFQLLNIVPIARRVVIENMSDGVIVLDAKKIIVDLNPAAQRAIGHLSERIIGKSIREILAHDPDLLERFRDVTEIQTEIEYRDQGAQRYADVHISPVYDQQQRFTGRVIVFRDITRRKQAENELKEARDRAMAASRLKSELLAKVSHELRTPLSAILGYTELLEAGIYGSISDEQQAIFGEVIKSTHHLTALVNELLDQAQLDSGRLQLANTSFSPVELVNPIEAEMGILAKRKGLTLTTSFAPELPPILTGDLGRLQQILNNLVNNAIKFTECGTVKICLYPADTEQWAISVSDTGPGIPPEARAYIFEPFRQVDGSMTRQHAGSGLGLSIVQQLTELMGGTVDLQSELGHGSTFTVLLPLNRGS